MVDTSFLPTLQQSDIHQAIQVSCPQIPSLKSIWDFFQLILQAYAPTQLTSPDNLKRRQHELFEIQKTDAARGLVILTM